MIKQTATTQIHMSDSLHIAAETVNVGEKYKTACRTTISAKQSDRQPDPSNRRCTLLSLCV
jgi:hypothetical protein